MHADPTTVLPPDAARDAPVGLFVHLPKCAGTSVHALLAETAPDRLVVDDAGSCVAPGVPATVFEGRSADPLAALAGRIVYGHFMPAKYLRNNPAGRPVRVVTILRDPLDRLVSHYRYYTTLREAPVVGDPHLIGRHNAVLEAMLREPWSFERFALAEPLRNIYAQYLNRTWAPMPTSACTSDSPPRCRAASRCSVSAAPRRRSRAST